METVKLFIKDGNSIWFDFKNGKTKSIIPYAGNPSDLYEYIDVGGWYELLEFASNNKIQIPMEHIELKYYCKDCEKGEDGFTQYLDEKCRKCKCEQGVFIVTHVKTKLKK